MLATNLWIGAELIDKNGNILHVEEIYHECLEDETCTVYNFQVEEYHTYFVGEQGILVHNAEYTGEVPNQPVDVDGKDVKSGISTFKPNQVHHYATDKSKTYTQAFKDITDKYGLDLDADWNKDLLPHQGRHPNAYHDFVLDEMRNIDNIANGNKDIFLDLYVSEIKSIIRDNLDMLYSNYWKGIKE